MGLFAGRQIAIVGAGSADERLAAIAGKAGELIARDGGVLVCGGLGGVMEAAAKGASSAWGVVIGILPGEDLTEGNAFLTARVATGMGHGRNSLVVRSAHGVIAVGGGYGTLSEIALALKMTIPVVGVRSWEIEGVHGAQTPEEAVDILSRLLPKRG
jgi:hypothetical protein